MMMAESSVLEGKPELALLSVAASYQLMAPNEPCCSSTWSFEAVHFAGIWAETDTDWMLTLGDSWVGDCGNNCAPSGGTVAPLEAAGRRSCLHAQSFSTYLGGSKIVQHCRYIPEYSQRVEHARVHRCYRIVGLSPHRLLYQPCGSCFARESSS